MELKQIATIANDITLANINRTFMELKRTLKESITNAAEY
jgi:hypothetical protein